MVRYLMPSSPAARIIVRADSAPCRCPSMRGKCRCLAQRPLPSMITATCVGNEAIASAERWDAGVVIWQNIKYETRKQIENDQFQMTNDQINSKSQMIS